MSEVHRISIPNGAYWKLWNLRIALKAKSWEELIDMLYERVLGEKE